MLIFGSISRTFALVAGLLLLAWPGAAAEARLLPEASHAVRGFWGRTLSLSLALDRSVPFRVFTLDAPPRLVIDLEGIAPNATGAVIAGPLPRGVAAARFGLARPGWARLVFDLDRPFAVETAETRADPAGARLEVELRRVGADEFAALSGAPPDVWAGPPAPRLRGEGRWVLALDPGHGGIDPGALRDGVAEKDVVLAFARDLRAALLATGRFQVILTREADEFLPLAGRVEVARAAGADAFLSLHTNAVADEAIAGGIVFTRSETGSSKAAADRAAAENRADGLAGLVEVAPGDPVSDLLGGIVRSEAQARSVELARAVSAALGPLAGPSRQAPLQSANFQVLGAPDVPSILVELGFLSNPRDRAAMLSEDWRARASAAIADALVGWAEAGGPLTRK